MSRSRLLVLAIAAGALVGPVACSGGRATTLKVRGPLTPSAGPAATGVAWQPVSYQRVTFEVPAHWPVFNLATDAHRCVRFDVHAVYLGHQGADAICPARLIGRNDAVQIEPLESHAGAQPLTAGSTVRINGLATRLAPYGDATRSIVAVFPELMLTVRVTYSQDSTTAQQILYSFRVAK